MGECEIATIMELANRRATRIEIWELGVLEENLWETCDLVIWCICDFSTKCEILKCYRFFFQSNILPIIHMTVHTKVTVTSSNFKILN